MSKSGLSGTLKNSFAIGIGTNTDGYVLFNIANANKPGIRYNSTTSKIQFSDNGTTYSDMPSTVLGRDLSNNLLDAYVVGFNGHPLETTQNPTDGQVFFYNAAQSKWWCSQINGDVTGSFEDVSVVGFNGVELDDTAPEHGQAYVYNAGSTKFVPTTVGFVDIFNVGGRLTLDPADPYMTSGNYPSTSTLYWVPINGGKIALCPQSGGDFVQYTIDSTLSVEGGAGNGLVQYTNYDVFMMLNTDPQLVLGTGWNSDSARFANEDLYVHKGVLVKQPETINRPYARYLGTVRTDIAANFEYSFSNIAVWNYYNRKKISAKKLITTKSWALNSDTTWRPYNNDSDNMLAIVDGYVEDSVSIICKGLVTNSNETAARATVGIGINSTSVNSADIFGGGGTPFDPDMISSISANFEGYLSKGYKAIYPLEANYYGGNVTMRGLDDGYNYQSGILVTLYG
jgi:hypothetical protein